jgi:hypothetical protein
MRRRDGVPLWLADNEPAVVLSRADLNGKSEPEKYSEVWLQRLLWDRPEIFPVGQIDPEFGALVPLCIELPLALGGNQTGYLDNLFVTSSGGLVLVEVKLWRNPEARRSAVAQAMEYAAAVFRMGYDELDAAVTKARVANGRTPASIFELVVGQRPEVDQAEFHDAVSRNLARGRAIIAVVGDGIREEMLSLANLVQGHAGHRFTFALVELAVYQVRPAARIVVPSVLVQTVLIERGVVRVEGDTSQGVKVEITAMPVSPADGGSAGRRMSISEDEFYELLGKKYPAMPDILRAFLAKADGLGVYPRLQGGLNLKHAAPEGQRELNLGAIYKDGIVDTGPATWWGRWAAGRAYNETLAAAIGGAIRDSKDNTGWLHSAAEKMPRLPDFLPQHEQLWLDAMAQYIEDIGERAGSGADVSSDADAGDTECQLSHTSQANGTADK